MKILTCIKQVPVIDSPLELDHLKNWLADNQPIEYRINRFDEFALEEALQIKAAHSGTQVDVISVGPSRVMMALQRAIGMGADQGIYIEHLQEGFVDASEIAALIAHHACKQEYDLIFTGIMAEDDMQCLVGPLLAAMLNLPCVVAAVHTQMDEAQGVITVKSEMEGGRQQSIQVKLPAVITVQSGINQPRYPSLSNLLRAKRQPLEKIAVEKSAPGHRVDLLSLKPPPRSDKIVYFEGSLEEKADRILELLHSKALLR